MPQSPLECEIEISETSLMKCEVLLKKEGRCFNLQILKKGTLIQTKPPGMVQEESILWKDRRAGYTLEV